MIPRPYQRAAFAACLSKFQEGRRAPLVVLPTGTGKSIIIKMLVEYALGFPDQKILCAVHTKELIRQNVAKIAPGFDAGIYSAGLARRDTENAAIFCGIASVYRRAPEFGKVNLLIVDECHLISEKDASMYVSFIAALREQNPGLCVVGFTATPFRLDSGLIVDGALFDCVAYDGSKYLQKYISEGFLSGLVTSCPQTELNPDGVKLSGGDYQLKALQKAVNVEALTRSAVAEIISAGSARRYWLVFASGIDHAEAVREAFHAAGVPAGVLHSKLAPEERDAALEGFRAGRLRALVNNNILTTGFDFPALDLIAVLRPTQSPVLWVQICGRGMRPAPGKVNCLILDFGRNIERLGPIDCVHVPGKRRGRARRDAPVKYCPVCRRYVHASARECVCGHDWPRAVHIAPKAATGAVLTDGRPRLEKFKVTKVLYSRHAKPGKVPSVRVTYMCGLRRFSRWICPEHKGYARRKFVEWWRARSASPAPDCVDGFLVGADKLRAPGEILVNLAGKYPEIINDSVGLV